MSEHIKVYDDFIGFTFNGKHCSEFGLLRTSDGDRYEDNLVLSLSDSAEDVPGGVGQYYFGENIKQREFNIRVAYDSVTEKDKREIRKWLHPDGKLHGLIFDEKPYIKYWVKCNNEVKSKELCFNETYYETVGNNQIEKEKRVYKGEFIINFVAYMPYGVADFKIIDNNIIGGYIPIPENFGNFYEWYEDSGLIDTNEYNTLIGQYGGDNKTFLVFPTYNPGDVESGFELVVNKDAAGIILNTEGTSASGPFDAYKKVNNKIDISKETYFIFAPDLYKLSGTNEDVKVLNISDNTEIDNGYIDNSNIVSMFVSNSNGEKYNILKFIENGIDGFDCTISNELMSKFKLKTNREYFCYDQSNNIINFYISNQDNLNGCVKITTTEEYPVITATQLKFLPDQDVFINCGLKKNGQFLPNYYFQLKIPAATTTEPKYWTEAQKMLYLPCQLKIDSNKQLIQYREIIDKTQNLYGQWIGISGIINQGKLFKIPTDNKNDVFIGGGLNNNKTNFFQIESADSYEINISAGSFENLHYEYLYI